MYRGSQFIELPFGYFSKNNEQISQQIEKKQIILKVPLREIREYSLFDKMLNEQRIYYIKINPIPHGFDRLILQTHLRFYCQSDTYLKNDSVEQIKGKCYKIKYDENSNPEFKIQEGVFNINSKKEEYHLQISMDYLIDDHSHNQLESIKKQQSLPQNLEDTRKIKQENIDQKRDKIIIMNEKNEILRSKSNEDDGSFKQIYQKIWVVYNQSISDRDESIIKSDSTQWVTSSLIDSLVEYLNKKSEQKINEQKLEDRIKINRILFVPSYVTTSFGVCDDIIIFTKKAEELLKQEFRFYKELNYDMKQVYGKIGFPVNINNMHWVFLLFDLKNEIITLYDSLRTKQNKINPSPFIKAIAKFLNQKFRKCYVDNYEKQKDIYSCGYYVSSFMKFEYKLQFNKQELYKFTQKEMKRKLRKIVSIK
ncbi:unnamed protein product [Paramecium sonneborni]|uniref:Ubiquitin-like protease family profile domain-containing protein n=1 Tax=Paramecium sonneborni TaxID=65129 RepID=A0A8S1RIY0_9CILI|nr:unnamed protein product [Paramecium sonneborni]